MIENLVDSYGWTSAAPTHAASYITPGILKLVAELGVRKVADLGSGNGALCAELAKTGVTAVGIEYDQTGVSIARQAHPAIKFYQAGVQDDPSEIVAAEGSFDAVCSVEVIEHLFSPQLMPIFAGKLLRPGGYLIITTPYHGYLKNLALSLAGKWDDHHTALWHGGHIKFWSRRTLSKLLTDHNFRILGFSGVGRVPYLWKSMMMLAQKR